MTAATRALLLSFAFLLPLAGAHTHARRDARQPRQEAPACKLCPTIYVECPSDTSAQGRPVKFTARISGAGDSPSLTLKWKVSGGAVVSGQNARVTTPDSVSEMTVDTTGVPGNSTLTATVEVGGLDLSCSNTDSCSTGIVVLPMEHYSEYGDISFEYEQALLDIYGAALMGDPTMTGYFACYGGRRGRRGEALARCERAKSYLVGRRGFAPDRIVLLDGGFRESPTVVLWMMPPGMKPPLNPTVAPTEVRFIGRDPKRKPRPARKRRPGA